jgi:hypothetical protein
MDDQTRDGLWARISQLEARKSQLVIALRRHADNIEDVRGALGNPYFYSSRPEGAPESKSRFTGYASHEPAFRLAREHQEIVKEIESIEGRLRAAGTFPGD